MATVLDGAGADVLHADYQQSAMMTRSSAIAERPRVPRATSQAVMEVLDNIYQSCDNSETTIGIYLAAFRTDCFQN